MSEQFLTFIKHLQRGNQAKAQPKNNADFTVDEINGDWFVIEIVAGPFSNNAAAWRWIDRNSRQRDRAGQRSRHSQDST
jgi:hypothetical protein